MGGNEREKGSESPISEEHERIIPISMVVLILGVFAPFMMMVIEYRENTEFAIMSTFWVYDQSNASIEPNGLSLIPAYMILAMLPFLLLRVIPVYQIYRYYNGKTTRRRAFIASFAGDAIFLYTGLLPLVISILFSSSYSIYPLPFQSIVAVLILWRFTMPEPITPWKTKEKPKSWWDIALETQAETFPDDDALREYLHAEGNSNH
jgi:hypothetical protein